MIFEKAINPYLAEVLQHPQSIKMSEGMLHILDVEGPKKNGSVETRLEAMEQQVFKCQGMVERGLNANHMMITEFTNNHKMDAIDIGKHLSRLYDRVDQLQGQMYDLQNQNCESPRTDHEEGVREPIGFYVQIHDQEEIAMLVIPPKFRSVMKQWLVINPPRAASLSANKWCEFWVQV
ncbi:40S ribosomal protein S5-1 [Hordeum vulgare]|nr:40S ribosomal protein S5-1 [Hordeum vulgare]